MRRLVFLLVSLSFLVPNEIYRELDVWNASPVKEIIELETRFHPTKKLTYKLMWKAAWKEFKIAVEKGDLKTAEALQHKGYIVYLNWLEDRSAVTYYYHHLMVRNL